MNNFSILRKHTSGRAKFSLAGFAVLVLIVGGSAFAGHDSVPDDLSLPVDRPDVVERGESLFSEKCSACHGGEGRGGRAPCLTCGVFPRSGNTNGGVYGTIVQGIPMSKMGGFGSSLPADDILSLVNYLRWKEHDRIQKGEIAARSTEPEKPLQFPGEENAD